MLVYTDACKNVFLCIFLLSGESLDLSYVKHSEA